MSNILMHWVILMRHGLMIAVVCTVQPCLVTPCRSRVGCRALYVPPPTSAGGTEAHGRPDGVRGSLPPPDHSLHPHFKLGTYIDLTGCFSVYCTHRKDRFGRPCHTPRPRPPPGTWWSCRRPFALGTDAPGEARAERGAGRPGGPGCSPTPACWRSCEGTPAQQSQN